MVRRKHPLEVFREQGRRFTLKSEADPGPRERSGAEHDQAGHAGPADPAEISESEKPRRSLRPRSASEPPAVAPEPAPAPERRAWSATGTTRNVRPPDAVPRPRFNLPLPRVAALLAGLVLMVGAAYALGLWPFAAMGEASRAEGGSGRPALKRWWFLPDWADRETPSRQETAGDANEEGGGEETTADDDAGAKPAAAAKSAADVEYWIVAGSVKLKAADRKSDTWRQLFKPDEQRIRSLLEKEPKGIAGASEFPNFIVKPCYADAKREDILLLVGPAMSADDVALVKLLPKVKSLGERFKDARIKAYQKKP